jgi:hypothetical protein
LVLAAAVGLVLGTCGPVAWADTWTGGGQLGPLPGQAGWSRSWAIGANWSGGVVPPPADINTFGIIGDGVIALDAPQTVGGLTFGDFTTTTILSAPPPPPPWYVTGTYGVGGTRSTPQYTGQDGSTYGPYSWTYQYRRTFDGASVVKELEISFLFEPSLGWDEAQKQAFRTAAEANIEGIWNNRFFIQDTATGALFPLAVDVTLGGPFDQRVYVFPGNGRGNMTNWYAGWTNPGPTQAHEFGHMLSLFDEYDGGALDPSNPIISFDGLMGWGANLPNPVMYARYYQQYADFITQLNPSRTFSLVGPIRQGEGLTEPSGTASQAASGGPNTLTLTAPAGGGDPVISVGEGIRDTYGCDYFTAGWRIDADLVLDNGFLDINMAATNNSSLMISGALTSKTGYICMYVFNTALAGGKTSSVWFTAPNPDLQGFVLLANSYAGGYGPSIKLADEGRLGRAQIIMGSALTGVGLLRTGAASGRYENDILSRWDGWGGGTSCPVVYADRSYQKDVFARDLGLVQLIKNVTLDSGPGGGDSAIAFGSAGLEFRTNNNYLIFGQRLVLGNSNPDPNTKTVYVNLGSMTEGRAGHRYMGGVNNLNRSINEAAFLGDDDGVGLEDFGQTLIKDGLGILEIAGDNRATSSGGKRIDQGVLRFTRPESIGSAGGVQPAIIYNVVSNRISAGVGIGWDGPLPTFNWPVPLPAQLPFGQLGALDIDTDGERGHGYPYIVNNARRLDFYNDANIQRLRLGSSSRPGAVIWSPPEEGRDSIRPNPPDAWYARPTYHVGGGGGTLMIIAGLSDYGGVTNLEMATTGTLLPGRIILDSECFYTGRTDIYAGTLEIMPFSVALSSGVWVGTTCRDFDGGFRTARAPFAFEGPGQLLLMPREPGDEPYAILSGPWLDGGAVGWMADVVLDRLAFDGRRGIGFYGATINSTLASVASTQTNLLHLGGEYSGDPNQTVTMTKTANWVITNNGAVPVALVKSGIYNRLDLTRGGPNTYTGGTAIIGGEVIVSDAGQLSTGPILIANGGRLHVTQQAVAGENAIFPNTLKGLTRSTPATVTRNGSVIEVDLWKTATFTGPIDVSLSPQTPFEKLGQGTLVFDYRVAGVPAQYPTTAANQWGLKLTEGLTSINQLPLRTNNANNGFLVLLGGDLEVRPAPPAPANFADAGNTYGFASLVSFQDTTSTITVQDGGLLRVNGQSEYNLMGTVILAAQDSDLNPASNVFHLSRNASGGTSPDADSRGTGTLDVRGGTVVMTTNGAGVRVLPQEAEFTLKLNGGLFNGMPAADLNGNLIINDRPSAGFFTQVDGEIYNADRTVATPATWTIAGTGTTTWRWQLQKVGPGTVTFNRNLGARVQVDPFGSCFLWIRGGTVSAGGAVDPFTDSFDPSLHVAVINDARFSVTAGNKQVRELVGPGETTVADGAVLGANQITQSVLRMGAGSYVALRDAATPVEDLVDTLTVATTSPGTAWLYAGTNHLLRSGNPPGVFSIGPGSTLYKAGPGAMSIGQGQSHGAGAALVVSGGTVNLNSDAGTSSIFNLTLSASGASTANLGATQHLAALNLAGGARANLAAGHDKVLVAKALGIEEVGGLATSRLDLADNAMIVDYDGPAASPLEDVKRWIASGCDGRLWDGNGIVSTTAAGNPFTVGLGYAQNDLLFAKDQYSTFAGEPVDLTSVLVKYTYLGDVNLDGKVDDNDVTIMVLGYDRGLVSTHTWQQGDISGYDGRIDDNDITVLVLNYRRGIGSPLGGAAAAVPEPATLALLALGGLALLRSGRRT